MEYQEEQYTDVPPEEWEACEDIDGKPRMRPKLHIPADATVIHARQLPVGVVITPQLGAPLHLRFRPLVGSRMVD